MNIFMIILLCLLAIPVILFLWMAYFFIAGAWVNSKAGRRLAKDREAKGLDPDKKNK
jgi:hypothetical protein